jgi:exodeoxyribonuclease-3
VNIATWNVNSLRVRLPQVLDWLAQHRPEVLCLQETKVTDEDFPLAPLQAAGYQVQVSGQKTYNGVAILTRATAVDVVTELPGTDSAQKRYLAATIEGVRVVNVYVPNGESVSSDKYAFKLAWLTALQQQLAVELQRFPELVIVGDFNIAPEDRDVYDPAAWQGQVLFSEPERNALQALLRTGLMDVFRRFEQAPQSYSWWDYRQGAFRRNQGLRIDHILASPALASRCTRCLIDVAPRRAERPSDHAPVLAQFT